MRQAMIVMFGVVLACSLAGPATATIPEVPRLRILDVEDGLPSSNINGITQDRSGYLWLATADGLARYDGLGMRVWRHVPGDPAALPGNYITAVHVDARDRVWVAVEGLGLSVMDARREGFRHYRMAEQAAIGSDEVWAIASGDDTVWFGTFGGGLHRLDGLRDDGSGGAITRYLADPDQPRSLPADTVLSLRFDAAGQLWIGSTQGLAKWTGRDFEHVALPGKQPAPMVYSITADGPAVWIGAGSGAFRREADGAWTVPAWSAMFEAPNAIFDVIADDDGQHWLASQRHLWRVAPGGVPSPVVLGTHGPVRPMFQMLRQADGGLWLPVSGSGLGYLRPDWRRIAQFSRQHGGLAGELYRDVVPAREGGVWLIGGRGEVERLDDEGRVHRLAREMQMRLQGRPLMSGVQDHHGRLWLGERRTLVRLDPAGDARDLREWREGDARDGILAGAIALLAIAPDGTLWSSSSGAGLQQRDVESGRVLRTILPGPLQGLGVGDVEALGFDDAGRLWLADERGLRHWDERAQRLLPARGIEAGSRVFAFAFDGADALWLQRLSGLEHYRRDARGWRLADRVGLQDGIPAVEGSDLRVDDAHRVWLSTLRGLYRWDPRQRHARRFGVQDGLSSQEFVKRAMTLTAQGQLAAAVADGGVVLVDTRAAEPPSTRPSLYWDRVEVRRGGRWVSLVDASGRSPSLTADDRELRVQLRLLAFEAPTSNRYFSKLDGYDNDWVAQGESGERVFAGLPAGHYRLRARATDAGGNAAAEQVLRFSVQPPWWRTAWALAGTIGLLLLSAWWAIGVHRARLRRREAQQRSEHERTVAEHASFAKTHFLATLGHEVRTPMTGVLGMSELLLGTSLDAQQRGYTQSIRQAGEHLLRLVNDALDLARIESGKLELDDVPFDLRALLDEAVALMAPLARQRGLAFLIDVADDVPPGVRGDAKRVCQILLNLIGNAIKFTDRGQVSLHVSCVAVDAIRFEVADTGPGLNEEQKARLFRRFEQAEGVRTTARYGGSGLGLAICQELAAAMGGQIAVDSTPGEGTRFIVELPLPAAVLDVVDEASTAPVSPRRSLALLLVEDDPTVVEVVAGLLRAQGHRVTHAGHGLAALAEIATARFDAALLDLDLPGIDGFALARQLRAQGFDRPLIALTARADAEAEPLSHAAGFDRFLRKPVTGKLLARLVEGIAAG